MALKITPVQADQTIIHVGDLIIDGTQTFVIENCTFIQTGNIYVKDEATLVIRNAELQLNQTERFQHSVYLTNFARLLIDNGTITSSYGFTAIEARNNAEIQIDRWNKSDVSASVYIVAYDSVSATIKNSNMSNWLFYREYLWYWIHFFDNSIGYIVNSTIDRLYAGYATKIDVLNSSIILTEAGSGYNVYENELVISYSYLVILYIGFLQADVTVTGLKPGKYDFWNTFQNFTMDRGPNITLVDTRVNHWGLSAFDSELRIKESILSRLEACWYWSKVFVEDSEVNYVELYFSDDAFLSFKDSIISHLVPRFSDAVIVVSNVTVSEYFHMVDSNIYLYGNATFENTVEVYWYADSVLKRNFGVICLDEIDGPIANAELILYDINASIVWDGFTDSLGYASFNLTFTSTNYTSILPLQAVKGFLSAIKDITMISDTPIFLVLKHVEIPTIIDIVPESLNLMSKGTWITAYIELPEGYNVSDIDRATILLNDTVSVESVVGDYDEDGIPDLMVKFDRAAVIDYIKDNMDWSNPERTKPLIYKITLTITGTLYDGTPFQGSDTIRVLKFRKDDPMPI